MTTVEAEMLEEEEATKHAIPFCAVRARVKSWDRALTSDDVVSTDGDDPAGGALEVVGSAVADKCGR